MTLSDNRLTQLAIEMTAIAGSPVRPEQIGGFIYFYCSDELGMYRLINYHKDIFARLSYGWSVNLKIWYVGFELNPPKI